MAILWWIIVGLIAGWATGKIMGGAGYGFIMDIVVGIIGALIGGFIMSRLGMAARSEEHTSELQSTRSSRMPSSA